MTASTPRLDSAQQFVVDHSGGPMLVLAGPGTGKTTTIVEAVIARLGAASHSSKVMQEARGVHASQPPVLVLTFGRAAADELRERIAQRLGAGVLPTVATFHSFSYALVREFAAAHEFGMAPRLIDAADQDVRLREMLTSAVAEGRVPWPSELNAAIGTQGLAEQVRALLARAQLLGFDEIALRRVAQDAGIATWAALADFLGEYLDVLDAAGVFDYSELIHRAVQVLAEEPVSRILQQRYSAIYVDEYQDTDPAQVRLLQALTTPESTLVAVGDPDQSIYGFRGADVRGILRFRDDFPTATGNPAEIIVLRETRRFGEHIAKAAGRVIRRVGLGGLPVDVQREHRTPGCVKSDPGIVEVVTFESAAAQATAVADRIRRNRLTGAVDQWADVAVITRTGSHELPLLSHALESVGIPVDLVADDIALHEYEAVATLLDVLSCAVDPSKLTGEKCRSLLFSAMIGMDGIEYRRLGRRLRNLLAQDTHQVPPTTHDAIRLAITEEDFFGLVVSELPARDVARIAALRLAIGAARAAIASGVGVQSVLWEVWDSTNWPRRLRDAARGTSATARAANRDLDSVIALFSEAARADESFGIARPVQNFLADVVSRSISTASKTASTGRDAVALLTAHRAKGLQWKHVYVVGVQEESWPDLRPRPSLLSPERLTEDGIGPPPLVSEALEAERRLFYVACTRAREMLVVTAVANAGASPTSGEQPSRFVSEVAADPSSVRRTHEPGYRLATLSNASIVASLRANLEAPDTSAAVKSAAATRLARLAREGVSAADPQRWWGLVEWTENDIQVRAPSDPLRMSGSSWRQLDRCSLAWFFEHEVKANIVSSSSTAFGSVLHELADAVVCGKVPAEVEALNTHLEAVWPSLGFDSDWQQAAELQQAKDAVVRFLNWHAKQSAGQQIVGSELAFNTEIEIPGDTVKITGSVDRLEIDAKGQLHIYDLKTQKRPESAKKLATNRQLELYQLVATEGVFDAVIEDQISEQKPDGGRVPVADASLILLRIDEKGTNLPRAQVQGPIDVATIKNELGEATQLVRGEHFHPTVNDFCSFCQYQIVCPVRPESGEVTT